MLKGREGEWEKGGTEIALSPSHPFSLSLGSVVQMLKKVATIASFPAFLAIARFFPWERIPSPCVFWRVTGLPCPSCGMTRSVVALTHLDLARAVYMNPLGIVFVVIFSIWWGYSVYEIATGRRTRLMAWASRKMTALAVTGIAVLFIYGGIRIAWLLRR